MGKPYSRRGNPIDSVLLSRVPGYGMCTGFVDKRFLLFAISVALRAVPSTSSQILNVENFTL